MDTAFVAALVAFTLIVISPGPAVLAIMATGISQGRGNALVLTLGILTGSTIWGLVALFGFSAFLATLGHLLVYMKLIGGMYLLYLAWKAFRAALNGGEIVPMKLGRMKGRKGIYVAGLLIHLTNPKAVLGWAATISIGVQPDSGPQQALFLTLSGLAIVWSLKLSMAILFSTPLLMASYQKARKVIQFAFAGFFAIAGLRVMLSR